MQKLLVSILVAVFLFVLPNATFAADLVPCGTADEPAACQACHVVQLTNNVVSWIVMILGIIAAILIVVAGARLVTSGGNVSAKEAAKSSMSNLLIGYLIVLSAWLVLDFGLKALLIQDGERSFGIWNEVSCVAQPKGEFRTVKQQPVQYIPLEPRLGTFQGWVSVAGTPGGSDGGSVSGSFSAACQLLPGPPGVNEYNCSPQQSQCRGAGGIPVLNPAGSAIICTPAQVTGGGSGGGGGSCSILSSGPCSVASLRPIFGNRAEDASRICNKESGGNPIESRSDICCGPNAQCSGAPSFSGGLFQINILAHSNLIPNCNLSSFFTRNGSTPQGNCVRRNARDICTGWSCSIVKNSAYDTCMQGARNTSINLRITKQLYDSRGFQPWLNSRNICSVR